MSAALRPYVTAGIALVGASIISVTPIAPSQVAASAPSMRVSTESVSLVADVTSCVASTTQLCESAFPSFLSNGTPSAFQALAEVAKTTDAADVTTSSIFNIPANLLITLANIPYNFLNALGSGDVQLGDSADSSFSFTNSFNGVDLNQTGVVGLAADLAYGGSIWVYSPFNVLGTDPADIARYQALINVLIPIPALSVGLGDIFATSAAALLPMSAGCTGTGLGACPDINSILSKSLNFATIYKLFTTGYDFGTVKDPITCDSDGLCNILNPDGPLAPQSGVSETLDPTAPFVSFYNSLTATPDFSSIKLPTLQMTVAAVTALVKGLNTFLNPFVLGTQCRLCALFVPTPPGTIIPGPTNPGTQFPPFTSPVGPVDDTATVTTLAKTTAADATAASDTTAAPKTPFKTWKANHEKAQAGDAAAAAAAVDAAGTVDSSTSTTSTTSTVTSTTKKDHPLASAIKDAFSKKSTTSDSGTDTAKVTKAAKTPKKTVKATKVSKAADAA